MLAKRSVIVKQMVNWAESDHEPVHFGRCDSSIVKTSADTRQSRARGGGHEAAEALGYKCGVSVRAFAYIRKPDTRGTESPHGFLGFCLDWTDYV